MKTSAEPYDFGRYLQQLRRAKEIPLEAVSQRTKIRSVVLHQIENEDLKALPTPTITKGFIRAFADAVGADRDEALRRYYAALNVQTPKAAQESPQKPSRRVWLNLILAILLIFGLIALSLYLVNLPNRSQTTPSEEKPKTVVMSPIPSSGEAAAPAPAPKASSPAQDFGAEVPSTSSTPQAEDSEDERGSPTRGAVPAIPEAGSENMASAPGSPPTASVVPSALPTAAPDALKEAADSEETATPQTLSEKMVLEVIADELTWFQITIDSGEPREMMIQPGLHRTFKAEKGFQLIIGNAAGVQLKLNGQPVSVPGRSGKVVHLQLP